MRVERREGFTLWIGGPVPPGAAAITIGSVISIRERYVDDAHLLRHELVHVRQWRELGFVRFGAMYLTSYVRARWDGHGHWAAYRRIPLEIEAEWEAYRAPGMRTGDDM